MSAGEGTARAQAEIVARNALKSLRHRCDFLTNSQITFGLRAFMREQ